MRIRRLTVWNVAAGLWFAAGTLWAMSCVGCVDLLGPGDVWHVEGARKIEPLPDWFRASHEAVEQCLGVERSFDRIRWFEAETILLREETCSGLWVAPSSIYLQVGRYENDGGFLVRHELIHYVLQEGAHRPATDSLFAICTLPPGYSCRTLEHGVIACGWHENPN